MIDIIDVSKHQGTIDWAKLGQYYKAGKIGGVIIRAGYGYATTDPKFEENYYNSVAQGIPVGAYWYAYWGSGSPTQECTAFLKVVHGKYLALGVWYDVEYESSITSLSKEERTEKTLTGLKVLAQSGRYCGLYASKDMINNRMVYDSLRNYAIWCAQYGSKCTCKLPYVLWQYSSTNALGLEEFGGHLDCDHLYKDLPSIVSGSLACDTLVAKSGVVDAYEISPEPETVTPRTTYTLKVGEMSNGDLKTVYTQARSLGIDMSGTLIIGPMTGGDYKTLKALTEGLGLEVDES